jgi:hypothetical protein
MSDNKTDWDEKGWDRYWAVMFGLIILPLILAISFLECSKRISNQIFERSENNVQSFVGNY